MLFYRSPNLYPNIAYSFIYPTLKVFLIVVNNRSNLRYCVRGLTASPALFQLLNEHFK
jgi:hypothetical protein